MNFSTNGGRSVTPAEAPLVIADSRPRRSSGGEFGDSVNSRIVHSAKPFSSANDTFFFGLDDVDSVLAFSDKAFRVSIVRVVSFSLNVSQFFGKHVAVTGFIWQKPFFSLRPILAKSCLSPNLT